MVNAQSGRNRNAACYPRNARAGRRAALFSLLLGWSAFWLVAVLQPCCKLALAQAQAAAADIALHTPDTGQQGHHGIGQYPADPAENCGSFSTVAHAPTSAAMAISPPSGGKASPAVDSDGLLHVYDLPRTADAFRRPPALSPPRAVAAFHLRTSRILI